MSGSKNSSESKRLSIILRVFLKVKKKRTSKCSKGNRKLTYTELNVSISFHVKNSWKYPDIFQAFSIRIERFQTKAENHLHRFNII